MSFFSCCETVDPVQDEILINPINNDVDNPQSNTTFEIIDTAVSDDVYAVPVSAARSSIVVEYPSMIAIQPSLPVRDPQKRTSPPIVAASHSAVEQHDLKVSTVPAPSIILENAKPIQKEITASDKMKSILKRWKLDLKASEDLTPFLEHMGVSWMARKALKSAEIEIDFSLDASQNNFTFTSYLPRDTIRKFIFATDGKKNQAVDEGNQDKLTICMTIDKSGDDICVCTFKDGPKGLVKEEISLIDNKTLVMRVMVYIYNEKKKKSVNGSLIDDVCNNHQSVKKLFDIKRVFKN